MTNRVRQLRKQKDLTQAELARRAKTSQQQIQRIETGQSATRLELALRIAQALDCSLDKAFPGMAKVAERAVAGIKGGVNPSEVLREARMSGVELERAVHHVQLMLRGRGAPIVLPVDAADRDSLRQRILEHVPHSGSAVFHLFRGGDALFAVNLDTIQFAHFLFDPIHPGVDPEVASGGTSTAHDQPLEMWFVGCEQPLALEMESENLKEIGDDPGPLGGLILDLEIDPQTDEFYSLVDINGEELVFRLGDVSLVRIPSELMYCDPDSDDE